MTEKREGVQIPALLTSLEERRSWAWGGPGDQVRGQVRNQDVISSIPLPPFRDWHLHGQSLGPRIQPDHEHLTGIAFFFFFFSCPVAPAVCLILVCAHSPFLVTAEWRVNLQAVQQIRNEHCSRAHGEQKQEPQPLSSRPCWVSGHENQGSPTAQGSPEGASPALGLREVRDGTATRIAFLRPATVEVGLKDRKDRGGSCWFSFLPEGSESVAVSPVEQTKQLKVISLCYRMHHQPFTKLLFAQTWACHGSG